MIALAAPPRRAPYYFDNEIHGWTLHDCACMLIYALTAQVGAQFAFSGAAKGRAWRVESARRDRGLIQFSTNRGDGSIELSVDESCWVKAELFIGGEMRFRAWIDEPWEEKEFWPDGADGVVPPNGDAPGRISKRYAWLQIRTAEFPGASGNEYGYFDLEQDDR